MSVSISNQFIYFSLFQTCLKKLYSKNVFIMSYYNSGYYFFNRIQSFVLLPLRDINTFTAFRYLIIEIPVFYKQFKSEFNYSVQEAIKSIVNNTF